MKVYVKPDQLTGPLGLEALDWDGKLAAILQGTSRYRDGASGGNRRWMVEGTTLVLTVCDRQ